MARWIALEGEELEDYLDGHMLPLEARETEHGVEVYMPHTFSEPGRYIATGHRICWHCGLLPLDYDAIEYECVTDDDKEN